MPCWSHVGEAAYARSEMLTRSVPGSKALPRQSVTAHPRLERQDDHDALIQSVAANRARDVSARRPFQEIEPVPDERDVHEAAGPRIGAEQEVGEHGMKAGREQPVERDVESVLRLGR